MSINKFCSLIFLCSSLTPLQGQTVSRRHHTDIPESIYLEKKIDKRLSKSSSSEALVAEKCKSHIKSKDYEALGLVLRGSVGYNMTLSKAMQIAYAEKCVPLVRAIKATEAILKLNYQLGLSAAELVQIALFIETGLEKYIKNTKYYLPIEETG